MARQRRDRRSGVGRGWGLSRQGVVPALPPRIPPTSVFSRLAFASPHPFRPHPRESRDPNPPRACLLSSQRFQAPGCRLPRPHAPSAPPQDALHVHLQGHLLREASLPASPFPMSAPRRTGAGGPDYETGPVTSYIPQAVGCGLRRVLGCQQPGGEARALIHFQMPQLVPVPTGRARGNKGASEALPWVPWCHP